MNNVAYIIEESIIENFVVKLALVYKFPDVFE